MIGAPAIQKASRCAHRPLAILVLDDSSADFELTREMLRRMEEVRAEAHHLASPDELERWLAEHEADLILCDHHLGLVTGFDVLAQQQGRLDVPPIIVVTGDDSRALDERLLKAGAADFLHKDELSPRYLSRAIRHALERHHTQQELVRSNRRYELATRGANDGIWDWEIPEGRLHYSERWFALLGEETHPAQSASLELWTARVHPGDRERFQTAMVAHLEGDMPVFECEHRLRHRDGSYRWMLARGIAIRDSKGRVDRMAGGLMDVTERREFQDRLISHVSHELRTPLAAIYQFGCNLRDGILGKMAPAQQVSVEDIIRNAEQLKSLIGALVEASRMSEGKFEVEPRRCDIGAVLESARTDALPLATQLGLELQVEIRGELPAVIADPYRIRQVVGNLLDNAMKFTPRGGRIRIDGGTRQREVVVAVHDTGPGIAPDHAQRIFERLAQVGDEAENSRKGLGLGLYLCREIVMRHAGKIWVESEQGQGSSFFFTLPPFSLATLMEPVFHAIERTGRGVALLSIQIQPPPDDPMLRVDEHDVRLARRVIAQNILSGSDVLLPILEDDAGCVRLWVAACADEDGAQAISERIRSRMSEELDPDLVRFRTQLDLVAGPRVDEDSPLERILHDVQAILGPRSVPNSPEER